MTFYAVELEGVTPAFGWQGGPNGNTDIVSQRNRHERRNARGEIALHSFILPFQNITSVEYLQYLKAAHMAMYAMTHSFLVKDWLDFQVTAEPLGLAPAGSTAVQLTKTYTFGPASRVRDITKPVAGAVIYQSGVAKAGTLNTTTGLFTPTTAWATLATPVNAAFTSATTGGTLAAGVTYAYRVSATNALGETLASTETSIAIAAALATPVNAAFSTSTTGGTLAAGTYYYRVSATNALGETLASAETSQVTTGATSTVTVNWGAVAGATGYKVYGRASGAQLLIATVGAVTTYTDTGSVTPSGALPGSNTTATATNRVTVNWGAVTGATGYKVYGRSVGAELLIASVGAVTTYSDTGSVTPSGALPTTNTTAVPLTWTGEFRVCVRFNNDAMPMTIDDKSGSQHIVNGSIELIEVPGE